MVKIATAYNNFARGKADHDMQGRFDLPLYPTILDRCQNYITNFKGNLKYRMGFENLLPFQNSAFVPFKFSNNQNYILVLYENKMRFLSYASDGSFGWVLDGAMAILEIDTPWTLAQAKEISKRKTYAQSRDVMYIVHEDHEPYKLTRLDSNDFSLNTFSREGDPFPLTFAAGQSISGITQAANAQITISSHGYVVGDRFRITGVSGMTEINDYTAAVQTVVDANNVTVDIDTADFTAYGSGGTAERVLTGDYPFTVAFYDGRLYYASTPTRYTTVWGSRAGNFDQLKIPSTVDSDDPIEVTIAVIQERIEWAYPGENSLLIGAADGIVALNGGSVNDPISADTVNANITSADGCNLTSPLAKDGFVFYVGRTSRNTYYFRYDILTEAFRSTDANVIAYDVTEGNICKMRYIKNIDNIVWFLKEDGKLISMNFAPEPENIIGWHTHETEGTFIDIDSITDNDGNPQLFALTLRDGNYYIERLAEYQEYVERSEFFTGDEDTDTVAYKRKVSDQLESSIYLDNAEVFNFLQDNLITYDAGAGTITATDPVFASGDVGKQIVYRTSTGYESGRFEITGFTSTTVVEVSVLQSPTANTYQNWYLTTDTLTGLSRFDGMEVAVVGNGAFINDFQVSGGEVQLNQQVTTAVVGHKYRAEAKTFTMGFQLQTENTQQTAKAVSRVGIRTNASVGGKIGTSPYRLESVQQRTQSDVNYLPATPVDGTKFVTYSDDAKRDQVFYMVQDVPGPFHITCAITDVNYGIVR